ncbi:hypothetical protein V6N12_008413 [Hibiscus sabdariffa]|uniref:RING-type domain-containing protein n=1 Tax=Hibiscus sabdariffa TaxID=183260 RepID=A0ABR2BIV8_9ROSI
MSDELASSSGIVLEGIDDVEDYGWENHGVGSLPWDRYSHVYDLMENGNQAFRENRFEEAINNYSRANNMKPGDPVILGNRCASYMRICQFLKRRSPTTSEDRPLNGLDMTTLAELALKDAERLVSLQNNEVRSYILKTNALILLERYEVAWDIILSGLQIDPFSAILRAALRSLERRPSSVVRTRGHEGTDRTDDFDCTLCLKLLYEPITTPCGHSFCRSCLFQTMDRSNKCPLCRTVLFISPRTCAISVTLNNIIQKNFPEEYDERRAEHDSLIHLGNDMIPLFVMDVVIPCQKFPLHIFEPRYRLMVRRIMEGNHRMGMVIRGPATDSVADFACEVEITECEPLPDGRFVLEIESRRRFRILRSWDQDGYRMAEVEWAQDVPPREAREREELQELTNNAAAYARSWLSTAKEATRDRRRLEMLYNVEAMVPNTRDPERFSFWVRFFLLIVFDDIMTANSYCCTACYSVESKAFGKTGTAANPRHGRGLESWAETRLSWQNGVEVEPHPHVSGNNKWFENVCDCETRFRFGFENSKEKDDGQKGVEVEPYMHDVIWKVQCSYLQIHELLQSQWLDLLGTYMDILPLTTLHLSFPQLVLVHASAIPRTSHIDFIRTKEC